jgi:alpha-glucosidase (family GH31 glycosyl hydrolase)
VLVLLFRWGYRTLDEVSAVVAGYQAAAIPLEVMWTDIDYMYKFRDFTFDPNRFNAGDMRKFVDR